VTLSVPDGDRLVARLIEVHDGLADQDREAFLARLVLLLADEIGDLAALLNAISAAARDETATPLSESPGVPG
jgi:hypothetical protein